MSNYNLTGFGVSGTSGKPGDIDTVQRNPLGAEAKDVDGNVWIYLAGAASMTEGDWVSFNATTYVAVRLAADAVGRVAIAPAAILATNWGWFMVKGFYPTSNSDTVAAAGGLFIDGTTGRVDDASVAGDFVNGAVSTAADTANKLPVQISYPYVTNTVPA
jgi:hypothetical protein